MSQQNPESQEEYNYWKSYEVEPYDEPYIEGPSEKDILLILTDRLIEAEKIPDNDIEIEKLKEEIDELQEQLILENL